MAGLWPTKLLKWRFARARATGTSHLRTGLPCQDRQECLVLTDGTLIAAVADGAGSASLAEQGAENAVKTVVRSVSAAIQAGRTDFGVLLREAAAEARENMLAIAQEQSVEVRELASTLLAVIAGPVGGAALQIGDGVIVVNQDGDGWCWVFWPQHGEYANTTRFLTDENATLLLQVKPFSGTVTDIALMTDGLEPLALHYASRSAYPPFFDGLFGPLLWVAGSGEITHLSTALEGFLVSARVGARTDDDVTLILATCRPPASPS